MKISILTIALGMILCMQTPKAEDVKGKIAKIMASPSTTAGKSVVTIFFTPPLEYWRSDYSCLNTPPYSIQFSDANIPLSTMNQILALALTAYTTGGSFAMDLNGNGPGGACMNGTWGYLLP